MKKEIIPEKHFGNSPLCKIVKRHTFRCEKCRKMFHLKLALRYHQVRAHGVMQHSKRQLRMEDVKGQGASENGFQGIRKEMDKTADKTADSEKKRQLTTTMTNCEICHKKLAWRF